MYRRAAVCQAKTNVYSMQSLASSALSLTEAAWSEVRKVPYVSENQDKRQVHECLDLLQAATTTKPCEHCAGMSDRTCH